MRFQVTLELLVRRNHSLLHYKYGVIIATIRLSVSKSRTVWVSSRETDINSTRDPRFHVSENVPNATGTSISDPRLWECVSA